MVRALAPFLLLVSALHGQGGPQAGPRPVEEQVRVLLRLHDLPLSPKDMQTVESLRKFPSHLRGFLRLDAEQRKLRGEMQMAEAKQAGNGTLASDFQRDKYRRGEDQAAQASRSFRLLGAWNPTVPFEGLDQWVKVQLAAD